MQMDTDSLYMALSKDSMEAVLHDDKKAEFELLRPSWFPRNVLPEDIPFDPEVHGIEHPGFNKRKPGLFKIDWSGEEMVGLCSKTYLRYSAAADQEEERENLAKRTLLEEEFEREDREFNDVFDLHDPDEEIVEPPPLPRVPEPLNGHKMSCKGIQKKRNKDRLTFETYVDV